MNNVNKVIEGNPLQQMEMKAEVEKIKTSLQSHGYQLQLNMDSWVYDGMDSQDHALLLGSLAIETGLITHEDILSVLPELLTFMEKSFPQLFLHEVKKNEANKIALHYIASEMDHYSSVDQLMLNELKVIDASLEQFIADNLLTDVKIAIHIDVSY